MVGVSFQIAAASIGAYLVIQALILLRRWTQAVSAFPIVGIPGQKLVPGVGVEDKTHLEEGYQKYRDDVYQLWTRDGRFVIVPNSLLDVLKELPDTMLDPTPATQDFLFPQYTGIETDLAIFQTVRQDLMQNISHIIPAVFDEASSSIDELFPSSKDWTSVTLYPTLLQVVGIVAGRVFSGAKLNRDPEWLDISSHYMMELFMAARGIRNYHWTVRPIMQYFVPELQKLHKRYKQAENVWAPVIADRNAHPHKEKASQDAMDWFRARLPKSEQNNLRRISRAQLSFGMASMHSTTQACTQFLFDLAAYPEYQQPLREEIEATLAKNDGHLPKSAMPHLEKLDSFFKESQRHNPPGYLGMFRRALQNVPLPDGRVIPKGSTLAAQVYSIAMDPEVYQDPEKFDGLRFYKLRQEPGNALKYQFATTSLESLHFGYGRRACPGRFFATGEAKIIVALLLQKYDISLEEGQTERPANLIRGTQIRANPEGKIRFKRRASQGVL